MIINLKYFKYFVMLLIVIQPKIFTQYKFLALSYAVLNIILFLYFFLKTKYKTHKFDLPIIIWISLRIYLLLMMIINNNLTDIDQWGYLSIMVLNIYFIISDSINRKESSIMIHSGTILCIVLLLINALSLIVFDNGIIPSPNIFDNGDGDYYFLGIKVAYTTYVLAALTFGSLNYKVNGNKLSFIVIIVLGLFNIFYSKVSTGIISVLILLTIMLLYKFTKIRINITKSLAISLISNILIIFFEAQTLFSNFIVNVLHKSISLTGRTEIWRNAIIYFKDNGITNLVFGHGIYNDGAFVELGGTLWPAHNLWLQYIFEVGILGTIIFIVMLKTFGKKTNEDCFESNFLLSICFVILFSTITTFNFGYAHIFIPFILLYFIEKIKKERIE